jgi:malate dehydrogenase (oxaloacetate-decarboxylating)
MKAAVEVRKQITDEVKMKAAQALAAFLPEDQLTVNKILPYPFEKGIAQYIANEVKAFFSLEI